MKDLVDWIDDVAERHGLETFYVHPRGDALHLHMLSVHKDKQGKGTGTAVMRELCAYADALGMPLTLNVARSRVADFYRRFGFVGHAESFPFPMRREPGFCEGCEGNPCWCDAIIDALESYFPC